MKQNGTIFGDGFNVTTFTEYLNNGAIIDMNTISVDLSYPMQPHFKLATNNIDTSNVKPGQILMIDDTGSAKWEDISVIPDKELRDEYPSLQISWDRVMEAIQEYELVKKLVQDYD